MNCKYAVDLSDFKYLSFNKKQKRRYLLGICSFAIFVLVLFTCVGGLGFFPPTVSNIYVNLLWIFWVFVVVVVIAFAKEVGRLVGIFFIF